jgi:hypothetical protein
MGFLCLGLHGLAVGLDFSVGRHRREVELLCSALSLFTGPKQSREEKGVLRFLGSQSQISTTSPVESKRMRAHG